MAEQRLRALFADLRQLTFDQHKESLHENLTDILEIVAVGADLKPAHVNGQGFRSDSLLRALEALAPKHRLVALRTRPIATHFHHTPRYGAALWERRLPLLRPGEQTADVFWLYRDPALQPDIETAVSGGRSVARVLGYPECCVTRWVEVTLEADEHMIETLRTEHGAQTDDDLMRLLEADTPVPAPTIITEMGVAMRQSRLRIPFVQFFACPTCLESVNSPAGRINASMRALAVDLSDPFAIEIQAASLEFVPAIGGAASGRPHLGRNDPCACASGRKFKKCCGPFV